MADKLMYIHNDYTRNYPFCRLKLLRLNTQLNETNNQNSLKSPKLFKTLYCNLSANPVQIIIPILRVDSIYIKLNKI